MKPQNPIKKYFRKLKTKLICQKSPTQYTKLRAVIVVNSYWIHKTIIPRIYYDTKPKAKNKTVQSTHAKAPTTNLILTKSPFSIKIIKKPYHSDPKLYLNRNKIINDGN